MDRIVFRSIVGMLCVLVTHGASGADPSTAAIDAFREWVDVYQAQAMRGAPVADDPAMIKDGIALASARRPVMARWIRSDPHDALVHSFSLQEWAGLPSEVRILVEEPFSAIADLQVLSNCSPAAYRETDWDGHRLQLRGRWVTAHVYGRWADITSKHDLPVRGVLLGDDAALWDSVFAPASAVDSSARKGDAIAHIIEQAALRNSPHAVADALASGTANRSGNFDLRAAEAAAIAADRSWTESPKRVLCLRLDYTPRVGTSYTKAALASHMAIASDAIRAMSFGKTWTKATVTPEVLPLPHSRDHYNTVDNYRSLIASDARAAAVAAGYDLNAYDIFIYAFPRLSRTRTPAWAGGEDQWVNGTRPVSVIVHELGHNYGLGHANNWRGYTGNGFEGHRNPDGSELEHTEYGDVFDLMGNDRWWWPGTNPVFPYGHFSMRGKALLNWIEPGEVTEVTESGTYRITRFDDAAARDVPGLAYALKTVTGDGEEIWVGFRRNFCSNTSLSTGAYVIWGSTGRSHRLIDTTPLSRPCALMYLDMEDAALGPGESWVDPSGTGRITTLAWGGSAPREYLDVRVEIGLTEIEPRFDVFTDAALSTPGLTGSYINRSLWASPARVDWRRWQRIAGTRVDGYPGFSENGWGARNEVGLTWGTDDNWDYFSAQWDGVLRVEDGPMRFGLSSDDGSRLWIDLNRDGSFSPFPPEFRNHLWGSWRILETHSPLTAVVQPGVYPIRIQYEDVFFWNDLILFGIPAGTE